MHKTLLLYFNSQQSNLKMHNILKIFSLNNENPKNYLKNFIFFNFFEYLHTFRTEMEKAFDTTEFTLEQMSNNSWVAEYGENIKESILSNLR